MTVEKPWYKYWPDYVPKEISIPEIPLIALLQNTAKDYPDAIATTYFGAQMTYATLNKVVDKIAGYLHKIGLKKGETVALYFTNNPACVAAYYGTLRAGGVVTLLSPLFQALEAKFQLNDSEAKVLIAWEGFEDIVKEVLPQTQVKHLLYSNAGNWMTVNPCDPANDKVDPSGKLTYLEDILLQDQPECPVIQINPKKDLAALQYTGGTTGMPKGAMLTHYNLVANAEQCFAVFPYPEMGKEVMLTGLPLYHIYAQTVAMNLSVRMAANMVMIFNPKETEDVIEKIEENKVTIFPGVAALYNLINRFPEIEKKDLHSIKYCLSGAGPLPLEIQQKFEKLTGAKLREGFGLTEASPITHVNPLAGRFKMGTVGFPVPNTDMKIVDLETGDKILGIGEIGELCVKGPQIMQGYYKKDAENKRVLRDGWLYTGDAAMMDNEGYTIIKERLKNMLKYKGHSVYPAEIESLLMENQKIFEVAVIGVPDKEVGENIKAYIVLKPEFVGKVDAKEITDWAKANMSSSKYPREIEFLSEIPKSAVGKILHRELRDMNKKK